MDCSLPGSSVHWISQARILEWIAISFSRESSQPRDWTWVSCIGKWILYHWATREACGYWLIWQGIFFVHNIIIFVVQSLSHIWLFVTPSTTAFQASLSFTISQSLLKLMSVKSVMPSNHFILCRPLLLPSIFHQGFSHWVALYIRWPKYWSFSFSPSNKYSVLISFRIDWFGIFAVQGTLKSRLL